MSSNVPLSQYSQESFVFFLSQQGEKKGAVFFAVLFAPHSREGNLDFMNTVQLFEVLQSGWV